MPLVSVIIPVYKAEDFIRKCVGSVTAQTLKDIEIICVDDGSPDNSLEILKELAAEDSRVKVISQPNGGAGAARNNGLRHATGEYLSFLDADDYWEPQKLRKQITLLEKNDYVLCATGRELILPDGSSTGRVISVPETITYRDLLKHNCINCSSVVIRTEVAREFPMHHAQDSHEDYIMWLEVLREHGDACAVNEPLLKYRLTNTGKSGNKFQSAWMTFKVYRYMGFGWFQSLLLFARYACYGLWKYAAAPKK